MGDLTHNALTRCVHTAQQEYIPAELTSTHASISKQLRAKATLLGAMVCASTRARGMFLATLSGAMKEGSWSRS